MFDLAAEPDVTNSDSKSNDRSGPAHAAEALDDEVAKKMVQLFKLLADETRLRILYYLMQVEELNVRSLCELLDQSQPAVSHHLALLRVAGLIDARRDGKHNFYRIVPQHIHQQLKQIFAASPTDQDGFRFDKYALTYEPQEPG